MSKNIFGSLIKGKKALSHPLFFVNENPNVQVSNTLLELKEPKSGKQNFDSSDEDNKTRRKKQKQTNKKGERYKPKSRKAALKKNLAGRKLKTQNFGDPENEKRTDLKYCMQCGEKGSFFMVFEHEWGCPHEDDPKKLKDRTIIRFPGPRFK